MDIAGGKTGRAALDQKATDTFLRTRPDDGNIGNAAVSNPHFCAVQNIRITITTSVCTHTACIAAKIRLRQAKTAESFAPGHAREPALLLLLRAKGVNRNHRQLPTPGRPARSRPRLARRNHSRPGASPTDPVPQTLVSVRAERYRPQNDHR